MRIIIEAQDSQEPSSVQVQTQDINAGPPSAALLQAMEAHTASADGSSGTSANVGAIDAGPPPQWLVDAIAQTPSPVNTSQGVVPGLDAGAAPAL